MDEIKKLIEELTYIIPFVREDAALSLGELAAEHPEYKWIDAIPALIGALDDENQDVRANTTWTLSIILDGCKTNEQIGEFQEKVEEGMKNLLKRYPGRMQEVPPDTRFKVATLMTEATKRKNSLAQDKGILLDDIPKPPKGNNIYQQLRAIRNG